MEKTINIGGRDVQLKATGSFLLRYKAQFGRDALQDIFGIYGAVDKKGNVSNAAALDVEVFYRLIWTLAKTADKDIPEMMEWLDGFDEFPIMDVMGEIMDIITSSIISTGPK